MALLIETRSVSLPKTQTRHLLFWFQAIDMCLCLFVGPFTLGLIRPFQAVWRLPNIPSMFKLGIFALFSMWAARNSHGLSPCGGRDFFVCLYSYLWTAHDSRNAHDGPISPVALVLQVTLLRIWGMHLQLPSHLYKNVHSVPLHGMLSGVESRRVDYTAFRELCTLS